MKYKKNSTKEKKGGMEKGKRNPRGRWRRMWVGFGAGCGTVGKVVGEFIWGFGWWFLLELHCSRCRCFFLLFFPHGFYIICFMELAQPRGVCIWYGRWLGHYHHVDKHSAIYILPVHTGTVLVAVCQVRGMQGTWPIMIVSWACQ